MNDAPHLIIARWELGELTTQETHAAILRLALETPLDDVLLALPGPWCGSFVAWLVDTYDTTTPTEEFVWLGSATSEPPGARAVITIARAWLRTHRTDAAGPRGE